MKKLSYLVVVVGFGLIIMAMNSIPDLNKETKLNMELKTITIYNETDMDIQKLFFSREAEEDWVEINFDVEKLNETRKIKIKFDVGQECYYDIKAINTENKFYIWETFDLCNEKEVFLYIEEEIEDPDTSNVDLIKHKF